MDFILGFLTFLVCQNIVFSGILNSTVATNDQNVTNNCTHAEIINGNCTLLPEEIERSIVENQTSFDDILTDLAHLLNSTEVPIAKNRTSEESIWPTINSSLVAESTMDRNATDVLSDATTSFGIPESYNRTVEATTDLNFTVQEENSDGSHTNTVTAQKNVLVLKSNCSVENSDEFTSQNVTNVGCTVYLNVNYVPQNGSRASIAKLIQELKPLSIRSGEFDIVENQEAGKIPVNEDKIPAGFLNRETFAYIAVAASFLIVLLIACIIFGLRCFKRKKPAFDMSRFDVKLSDYTLTRIPRVTLSSTESLNHPKLVDRPKYSTVPRGNNGPLKLINGDPSRGEGLLDFQDRFPTTREFKTFKSGRVVEMPANHIDNNFSFNSAYENPSFQRYF